MRRILLALPGVLLCLLCAAGPVLSTADSVVQTKVLQPSKDNTLIGSPTGVLSNGKGGSLFVGRTGQPEDNDKKPITSLRRGLLAFDIASAIPAGSRITSVKLTLNLISSAGGGQATPLNLHRVLQDWGEGDSIAAGPPGTGAAKGDATWLYASYDTVKWSHRGGDYAPKLRAAQTVADVGTYTWGSTAQMVTDVQAWLNAPKKSFGWILIGDETKAGTAKIFQSREAPDEQARPQLTVTYRPPARQKK